MLGYSDSEGKLAVEKFMQRYYQVVLSIRGLNDVLLQYLDEAIYRKGKAKHVAVINDRFLIRDNYLDTVEESVFKIILQRCSSYLLFWGKTTIF